MKKAPGKGALRKRDCCTKKRRKSVGCDRDGQKPQFIERLDLIAGAQLIIDVFYVLFYGIGADVQAIPDLLIDIAHGHKLEHFFFPARDG